MEAGNSSFEQEESAEVLGESEGSKSAPISLI